MNYAEAKAIASDHAPDLLVDPEVKGQPHICVRTSKSGPPFSITLITTDNTETDADHLKASLDQAVQTLGTGQ